MGILSNGVLGGLGRGLGNGNPLQYFCLENPMDRRAWWATVHGVARVRYLVTKPPQVCMYVFVAMLRLHCCSGTLSACRVWRCVGFSLQGLLLCRAQAQQLWCTGLVARCHVGSSQTRDRTCVYMTHWQVYSYPLDHQGGPRGFSFQTVEHWLRQYQALQWICLGHEALQ